MTATTYCLTQSPVRGKVRARLATEIIIAIISAVALIIVAIITYSATTYNTRHSITDAISGSTATLEFQATDSSTTTKAQSFDLTPVTGKLYVAAKQTKGDSTMTYKFQGKKSSSSLYTTIKSSLSFSKNNVYSSLYGYLSVSEGTKYTLLVSKTAGCDVASKISTDWVVR